jgi:hypothetical protein
MQRYTFSIPLFPGNIFILLDEFSFSQQAEDKTNGVNVDSGRVF